MWLLSKTVAKSSVTNSYRTKFVIIACKKFVYENIPKPFSVLLSSALTGCRPASDRHLSKGRRLPTKLYFFTICQCRADPLSLATFLPLRAKRLGWPKCREFASGNDLYWFPLFRGWLAVQMVSTANLKFCNTVDRQKRKTRRNYGTSHILVIWKEEMDTWLVLFLNMYMFRVIKYISMSYDVYWLRSQYSAIRIQWMPVPRCRKLNCLYSSHQWKGSIWMFAQRA